MSVKCPNCGNILPDEAFFCDQCGTVIGRHDDEEASSMNTGIRCPGCGKELTPGASFCDGCGTRVDAEEQQQIEPEALPDSGREPEEDGFFPDSSASFRQEEETDDMAFFGKDGIYRWVY